MDDGAAGIGLMRRAPINQPGRQRLYKMLSLFLQYPTEDVLTARAGLAAAARALPDSRIRRALEPFLAYWEIEPPAALLQHYVATFDLGKRTTLYLSYYLFGDRRQRGTAFLRLKQSYDAAGLRPATGELPDYLPLVLECAAAAPQLGETILRDYGAALALLHRGLTEASNPYTHVLSALRAALPPLDAQARGLAERIAREGPPGERVGLEPFVPPETPGACAPRAPTLPAHHAAWDDDADGATEMRR